MSRIKPRLEPLEDRCLPSVADVLAFQSQVTALHAQFDAAIPAIQINLQQFLTSVESSLTPAQQQQFAPQLAQAGWAVANFPALAEAWFNQQVAAEEKVLLAVNDGGAASSGSSSPPPTPSHQTGYFLGWHGTYYGWGYGNMSPMPSPLPLPKPAPMPSPPK